MIRLPTSHVRPPLPTYYVCPEFAPDCAALRFCEAWWCAVVLRKGLTGRAYSCPISGAPTVITYPLK